MTPVPEADGISPRSSQLSPFDESSEWAQSSPSLDHRESPDRGPQLDDLVRRLRAWSSASWGHGERLAVTREQLQLLADDGARAAGRAPAPVPDLSTSAVPDQLIVLAEQAMQDGVDPAPYVARIAAALGFSR